MKQVNRVTVAFAITCALLAGGCMSTGGGSTVSKFPIGKYQNGDSVAIFNADGTYVGTTTTGNDWVKGNYKVSGNEFTMQDTWEGEMLRKEMGTDCIGIKGRYSWMMAGDVLTATAIDDPCEGRKRGTSGVAWTRMP